MASFQRNPETGQPSSLGEVGKLNFDSNPSSNLSTPTKMPSGVEVNLPPQESGNQLLVQTPSPSHHPLAEMSGLNSSTPQTFPPQPGQEMLTTISGDELSPQDQQKEHIIRQYTSNRKGQKKGTEDRPHCHRLPVFLGKKVARDNFDNLTAREMENMLSYINQDTRQQERKCNVGEEEGELGGHSLLEHHLNQNMKKGTPITAQDANRAEVWINRIERGIESGDLLKKGGELLLSQIAQIRTTDGLSVLYRWKEGNDMRDTNHHFNQMFNQVYDQNVSDLEVALSSSKQTLNQNGKISKKSSLVRRGYLVYGEDGKVDTSCEAFRKGLVDNDGRPTTGSHISPNSSTSEVGYNPTVYSGSGRPKNTDYNEDGTLNRGDGNVSSSRSNSSRSSSKVSSQSSTRSSSMTSTTPTIYSGSGRPRNTDYNSDGTLNRGDGNVTSSSSSRSSQQTKTTTTTTRAPTSRSNTSSSSRSSSQTSTPTVYSGVGRPKNSDYNSDGSLNRGGGNSSSSSSRSSHKSSSSSNRYSGGGGYSSYSSSRSSSSSSSGGSTVYRGVGRPRASDYNSNGTINRG